MAPPTGLRPLLLVVPASAALVAGYTLLGPGARRDVRAARIYAAPSTSGEARSGRVTLTLQKGVSEAPIPGRITIATGGAVTTVDVGDDGAAEFAFDRPIQLGDSIVVRDGDDVLASAPLALPPSAVLDDLDDRAHTLELGAWGGSTGELVIAPRVLRGPLVPTFAADLVVEIRDKRGAPVEATLSIDAIGGECAACAKPIVRTSDARVAIVPSLDIVSLTLDATAPDGRKGHASAEIPVRMGALHLSADDGGPLHVSAPSKRRRAYASYYRGDDRIGGASADLTEDASGRFAADFPRPSADIDLVALTTDPEEAGHSTLWSLAHDDRSTRRLEAPRLLRTVDGLPDLLARESRRVGTVHRLLFAAIGALSVLEILLLTLVARGTRRELTTHFEHARDDEDIVLRPAPPIASTRSSAVLILTVGLGVVIAAAAMVGLAFVRG